MLLLSAFAFATEIPSPSGTKAVIPPGVVTTMQVNGGALSTVAPRSVSEMLRAVPGYRPNATLYGTPMADVEVYVDGLRMDRR